MASSSQDNSAGAALTALSVTGMTCAHCARRVTEALQRVPGVESAVVSLPDKKAQIRWRAGFTGNTAALVNAVAAAGYKATPV
jgi:mercuric reductase